MKKVTIYTDGACSGNPGNGGWGAVLLYKGHKKEISAAEPNTTNNRMELMAAIKGLEQLKEACQVELFSDSAYMVNAFTKGWVDAWQQNGFKGADNKPIKNLDLWQRLLELARRHEVTFFKVKGHADNELNNRCDQLATSAIKTLEKANPQAAPEAPNGQGTEA